MRRRRAEKRELLPDPKYNSVLVSKFINMIMLRGKRSIAEKIVYRCFDRIGKETQKEPLEIFSAAIENARPLLEVKPRRIGGATYQVPIDVRQSRGVTMAMMWIRNFAKNRKNKPMEERLTEEILECFNKQGSVIKKREDTHKMAESNKAFAHFRW
ncbi:MAG: 30S ribosomal protein S7 [Candidatus Omnitrophota bacterium]